MTNDDPRSNLGHTPSITATHRCIHADLMSDPIIQTTGLVRDLILLAPGSSMDLDHPHLARLAALCEALGLSTWRFQFHYRDKGQPFPPRDINVTIQEYELQLRIAAEQFPNARLHLGGHSYGARVATHVAAKLVAASDGLKARLRSVITFSLPVHPAKTPHLKRWNHTNDLTLPVCLVSGDRDTLAEPAQLNALMAQLENPLNKLTVLPGTDHGFGQLAKYRQEAEAYAVATRAVSRFLKTLDEPSH